MSNPSLPDPSPPAPAAGAHSEPQLAQVVDDDTPRLEAIDWAVEALYDDRTFEEVEATLVAGGWADDVAAGIVEEARRRTRGHRGALTREQVVLDANRMYRRATGRWYVGMPIIAAAWRLLHSVATLLSLRQARRADRRKI